MSAAQLDNLAKDWRPFSTLVCVPRTEEEYNRLVALLDEVTDEVGENEGHPLASFMDVLGALVEDYEENFVPELM
jgi:HTH-type transcriptional regulator / antitoxin HigA